MALLAGYQDQGKRKEQQDSYGFFESKDESFTEHAGKLAIVADGMGGLAQGREASSLAIKKFIESYNNKKPEEKIASALLRSLHYCNKAVYKFSESQGMDGKIGTTLVAAVLKGNNLYWVSVGDSRIYLLQQGHLSLLTTDHSYESKLEELVAQGKISKEDADSHPQKASLTSYIGSEEIDLIDRNTSPLKCFNSNKVLLCSDGLYSRFTNEEISSLMNADPLTGCKNLVSKKLSMNIKKQDNLTAVIMEQKNASNGSKTMQSSNNNTLIFASFIIIAVAVYMFFKPGEGINSINGNLETDVISESQIKEPGTDQIDTEDESGMIITEHLTKNIENESKKSPSESSVITAKETIVEPELNRKESLNLEIPEDPSDLPTPVSTKKTDISFNENNNNSLAEETPNISNTVKKDIIKDISKLPSEDVLEEEDLTEDFSEIAPEVITENKTFEVNQETVISNEDFTKTKIVEVEEDLVTDLDCVPQDVGPCLPKP